MDERSRDLAGDSWREYSKYALPPILNAALHCFMEQGYHGTTIRLIAAKADLSVPGLYHHYQSKQALLVAIVSVAMEDLWHRSLAAIDEGGEDVVEQFALLVECLALFHANRRELAFIAFDEIRSLEGQTRNEHIGKRDRQQQLMDDVIQRGVDLGHFTTPFPREFSRAIVTMCLGVSWWYRLGGELTPHQLAHKYVTMARMGAGVRLRTLGQ